MEEPPSVILCYGFWCDGLWSCKFRFLSTGALPEWYGSGRLVAESGWTDWYTDWYMRRFYVCHLVSILSPALTAAATGALSMSAASVLAGASTFLACMLALNFVRSTFSAAWLKESAWSGSEFEALLMHRSKDFVSFLMLARDELMCSENPSVMLGVCPLSLKRRVLHSVVFMARAGRSSPF
jgi:hypothetical protein